MEKSQVHHQTKHILDLLDMDSFFQHVYQRNGWKKHAYPFTSPPISTSLRPLKSPWIVLTGPWKLAPLESLV